MAIFHLYKLHFTSQLHLGDARDDYSISLKSVQSDTLHAALVSCLAMMGKEIPVDGDLGFSTSSLFPFYQKDESDTAVFFFPKPLTNSIPEGNIENAKKIKKVSWLDKSYFEKVLAGENLFTNSQDVNNIHGEFLSTKEIEKDFIKSLVIPRVKITRSGSEDSVPFYMDRIFFSDHSGLFFIATGDTSLLETALNLLQHEGIGTDRSVGNGFFTYSKESVDLEIPSDSKTAMSLSLFIPESKKQLQSFLEGNNVAYDFLRRGGWVTTHPHNTLRKNAVYAFTPGSVFYQQMTNFCIMGKIVDLKPDIPFDPKIDHPVWRNGKSIFLPIKIN